MRSSAILLCLAVMGCAAMRAPSGDENVVPHLADEALVARDGTPLPLREWDADGGRPKAVIIALHGMSDYSNALAEPGQEWAKHGITTLAIDQRGFGHAPYPGLWPGSALMRQDLDDFAIAAHARFPGVKIFALGESMGGAVLLSALASPRPPEIDGAILISPAIWSRSDMPLSYRVALFVVAHLMPGIVLTNSAANHIVTIVPSDNVPMLIALAHDPLFQKTTRADALEGLVNLMDEASKAAGRIKSGPPILFLHGAKDQVIPPKSAASAIAALGTHAQAREYPDGYHMLLRDIEGPMVQDDVASWVLAHAFGNRRHRRGNLRAHQPFPHPSKDLETMMTEKKKKHDLRDEIPVRATITNTQSRMAGGADNPNVADDENPHLVRPGPTQRTPVGQGTKGG
jgi:acylglycerol lipase